MKVLIVGSGGREHSIAKKLLESKKVTKLYSTPSNGGISTIAECLPYKVMDFDNIVNFSKQNKIDLVVVAPDDPLVGGLVDKLESAGVKAFGPRKNAAIIEGSKSFSKQLMKKYNIPTADYEVFDNADIAIEYIYRNDTYPIVIKADGLALGKGVIIAESFSTAQVAVRSIMEDKAFGSAGNTIVVEKFLTGPEVSILAFTDGKTIRPMVSAQDHKRALDNDQGLNTGGMGTFSPSRIWTKELETECMQTIFEPTMNALNNEGRTFKGIIFFGLMLTPTGVKVIEYNARFGDPETQVILPRLKGDLFDIFMSCIDVTLKDVSIEWEDNACVCVVLASGGYPEKYETGFEISGIENLLNMQNIDIIHAGTICNGGKFYTNGGRVLGIVAKEPTLDKAIETAYKAAELVTFSSVHYRKDIGRKPIM